MINHARTLLLNEAGKPTFDTALGEEIVPASYLSVALPESVQQARNILFGSEPDRDMLNYRARQYMLLLHETDLLQFVTGLDGRVTYSFDDDPFFDDALFRPQVEQVVGSGQPVTMLGRGIPPDASGQMLRQWTLTIQAGSVAEVRQVRPLLEANTVYTVDGGLTSHIDMPGTTNQLVATQPSLGDQWEISLRSRPTVGLGDIAATLRTLGEPVLLALFGIGSPVGASEPMRTFYNLWNDHHELAMSLGGLLLAVIYQTERARLVT